MPWHQLANAREKSTLVARVPEGQVFGKKRFFELGRDGGVFEKGLDFRGKREQAPIPVVIERLDAEPIASAEQRFRVLVPQSEREHPAKLKQAIRPVFFVCVQNGLGVAT